MPGLMPAAPTAAIDAGQISRISSRKGARLNKLAKTPAQPQKNWGEVAMMTFGLCDRTSTASGGIVTLPVSDRVLHKLLRLIDRYGTI